MDDNLTDRLDVIAVGAHPDDVEVACGGTLAKLVHEGKRVGIVDLTDGEPTPHSTGPEQRKQEARMAAETLGVSVRLELGYANRKLMDGFEPRIALASVFRKYRPSVVIGFGGKTPLASPDHFQVMQITDAAVFYSQLSRWDDHFDGLKPHKIKRQLYFRLPFESTTIEGNSFHLLVDISDTLEQKISAIKCFRSQFDHKTTMEQRIRAGAVATGALAGIGAAESFAAARPFATNDLYEALGLETLD